MHGASFCLVLYLLCYESAFLKVGVALILFGSCLKLPRAHMQARVVRLFALPTCADLARYWSVTCSRSPWCWNIAASSLSGVGTTFYKLTKVKNCRSFRWMNSMHFWLFKKIFHLKKMHNNTENIQISVPISAGIAWDLFACLGLVTLASTHRAWESRTHAPTCALYLVRLCHAIPHFM